MTVVWVPLALLLIAALWAVIVSELAWHSGPKLPKRSRQLLAGLLLIGAVVLFTFVMYRAGVKIQGSTLLRFLTPGRLSEPFDLWTIMKWGGPLVLIGLLLIWGGLPGINTGDGSPAASSAAPASATADPPPPAVCHPGNTVRYRGCESWFDPSGESCGGDGCKAGAYLAAQRRLTG